MLYEILAHTPLWVWGILLALLWLGLSQSVPRRARLRRVLLLPLAMTVLSLYGTFTTFHPVYWSWVLWAGAAAVSIAWFASSELPAGVDYDPSAQVFRLPGSWMPLGLMMAIFLTRYVVAVVLAMHPALTHDVAVAAIVASLYGALSGVFIGRLLRLLRRARESEPAPPAAPNIAWG